MKLKDTFVKNAKHSGAPSGDKYSDGDGMYLLVTAAGKYWRMDYPQGIVKETTCVAVTTACSLMRKGNARKSLEWTNRHQKHASKNTPS